MINMQRYHASAADIYECSDGTFVMFDDAQAAIAAAQKDMLDKCIEAVEALRPLLFVNKWHGGYDCCGCSTIDALHDDSINAMRALQEKQ